MTDSLEKRYSFLVNNILDIIIEIDLNGIITYVSPQINDVFGHQVEELIGLNVFDFIHSDDLVYISDIIEKVIIIIMIKRRKPINRLEYLPYLFM